MRAAGEKQCDRGGALRERPFLHAWKMPAKPGTDPAVAKGAENERQGEKEKHRGHPNKMCRTVIDCPRGKGKEFLGGGLEKRGITKRKKQRKRERTGEDNRWIGHQSLKAGCCRVHAVVVIAQENEDAGQCP